MAKSNETFTGGEPTWANACVGDNGFPGYWEYAKGYSQAANILIETVLDGRGQTHSVDEMVYPISFNMRHSIELRLKGAILELIAVEKYRGQTLEFNFTGTHNIGNMWSFFVESASSIDDRYQSLISKLDKRISDFAKVDPTGQTFRYPINTESQKHLVDIAIINFVVLRDKFSELEASLDRLHSLNIFLREEYARGSFTKNLSRKNLFELASLLPQRSSWVNASFRATKNALKKKFMIGSNELSKSIKFIESHYELAPLIGLSIPLRGLMDDDIKEFFCHWSKQHKASFSETRVGLKCVIAASNVTYDDIVRRVEIQAEVWRAVRVKLTPETLAGLTTLFYFAHQLSFSEYYVSEYETNLNEAKYLFSKSENSVRESYFHLFDKTNALTYILRSLYFLHKVALADALVALYDLEESLPWLTDARSRALFQKPDFCGYGGYK